MKIKCITLFDITRTNVNSKRLTTTEIDVITYNKQRAQQSNFETILQVISMRSQPEDITDPVKEHIKFSKNNIWGSEYKNKKSLIPVWAFNFTVNHDEVFENNISKLGNLFDDCNGVPMIVNLEEWTGMEAQLNTSLQLKNIHFEVIND